MLHIRRETMTRYLEKHICYADLESDEWVKRRLGEASGVPTASLFRSHLRYRQWLRRHVWPSFRCVHSGDSAGCISSDSASSTAGPDGTWHD